MKTLSRRDRSRMIHHFDMGMTSKENIWQDTKKTGTSIQKFQRTEVSVLRFILVNS